jgi:uncharacterized coiled-coil DUF342 family protein
MSLADTELSIGGVKFKGIYIAIVLSLATTIGGGVWTASSLYSRLEAVEGRNIPDIVPLEEQITLIETQLKDNNVAQLQGKLAELGTNLVLIKDQYEKMSAFKTEIAELDKQVTEMQTTVAKAEIITQDAEAFKKQIDTLKIEVENLWQGLNFLSNPYK